ALIIPGQATAPVLIIVGLLMAEPIKRINLEDYTEALPAFLTLIMMPLTYSIANGLIFGILSYVVLKLITGRFRDVKPTMWVLAALFVLYIGYGQLCVAWWTHGSMGLWAAARGVPSGVPRAVLFPGAPRAFSCPGPARHALAGGTVPAPWAAGSRD